MEMVTKRLLQLSDADLVEMTRGGCNGAFEALYLEHAGRVAGYLARSGFVPADVQDLTQETFIRVFKSLHTFDSRRGSFRVWLSMIAKNVARRRWSRRTQGELFDPALAESLLVAPLNPADTPQVREEMQGVRDCIAELPDELERVVRLRYVEGRTTRGIAAATDIPEATVRLRLEQGRKRIADCLRAKGIVD